MNVKSLKRFKGVECRVTYTCQCIAGQASTFSVCCFSEFLRSVFLSLTVYHFVLVILHMFHSVWMDPHKLAHVQLRSRQGTLSSECWWLAFFSNSTLHRCGSSFSSSHTTWLSPLGNVSQVCCTWVSHEWCSIDEILIVIFWCCDARCRSIFFSCYGQICSSLVLWGTFRLLY